MSDIGKKMFEQRKKLGLTLEQVGDAVGVGKSTVRKWENGTIKNMKRDKISALAKVLQMNTLDLVPAGSKSEPAPTVRVKPRVRTTRGKLAAGIVYDLRPKKTEVDISVLEVPGLRNDKDLEAVVKMWPNAGRETKKTILQLLGHVSTVEVKK